MEIRIKHLEAGPRGPQGMNIGAKQYDKEEAH